MSPRKGRSKQIGSAYANRTDLPVQTPTGMPYGEAGKLQAAQRKVPLAAGGPAPAPGPPTAPAGDPIAAALAAAQAHNFQGGGLGAPTQRPDEPVTTGLPTGPGAGPEAMGGSVDEDPVARQLRALYTAFPNADLAELLEDLDNGVTF